MSNTMPTRVDGDLFEAAKSMGAVASRSAAQQLSHWARIGRELEASPGTSMRDVQRVLAGESAYDALDERGQAVVRARWSERTAERLASLDLAAEFTKSGRVWTDADSQGLPVTRNEAVAHPAVGEESPTRAGTTPGRARTTTAKRSPVSGKSAAATKRKTA